MTTLARIGIIDYTYPYLYTPVSYMMPVPDSAANIKAVIQPFQLWVFCGILQLKGTLCYYKVCFLQVWIGLLLSIPLVTLIMYLLDWFQLDKRNAVTDENSITGRKGQKARFAIIFDYVLATLLYQGIKTNTLSRKGCIYFYVLCLLGRTGYSDSRKGLVARLVLGS